MVSLRPVEVKRRASRWDMSTPFDTSKSSCKKVCGIEHSTTEHVIGRVEMAINSLEVGRGGYPAIKDNKMTLSVAWQVNLEHEIDYALLRENETNIDEELDLWTFAKMTKSSLMG